MIFKTNSLVKVAPPVQHTFPPIQITPQNPEPPYHISQKDPIASLKAASQISKDDSQKRKANVKSKRKKLESDFDDLLSSIFETDDLVSQDPSELSSQVFQPNTAAAALQSSDNHNNLSIWFAYSRPEHEPCLANAILIKLDEYVRRTVHSEFFKTLEIEKIQRLFQILERSLQNADNALVSTTDLLDLDLGSVQKNLIIIDNSLKAIKVFFRIWLSGRLEKELLSEDLLTSITGLYSKILETQLLPLCEKELSTHSIMKARTDIGSMSQELTRITDYFSEFITTAQLNEASVTKLEFLTIKIIFQEVPTKQKDLIILTTNMESLRASSIILISTIYGNFVEQQGFILDEILSNFTKLNSSKNSLVYRLSNGKTVHLVTVLITRLIQTTGPTDKSMFRVNLDALNDQEMLQKAEDLTELCTNRITNASKSAAEIIQYLISRAMKTTKSGDSPFRQLIDCFTDDFSKLLYSPEWPAAELLFSTMASLLIKLLDEDNEGVLASTMALELLANIESKIFQFHKKQDQSIELALNMPVLTFNEYTEVVSKILFYLQSLIPKDPSSANSYQYLICLYTSVLSSLWHGVKDEEGNSELHEAVSAVLLNILSNGKEGHWKDLGLVEVSESPSSIAESNYFRFLSTRNMSQLYDRIMDSILRSLNHSKINIRTKGFRTISTLLEQNSEIFSLPQVQQSLNQRIYDASPQVRDATVDIIGKYIILKPETAKNFYMMLCDRSSDTGLSVRKRVIRLLHELYLISDDKQIKVEIAERIIRRIDDEEKSIGELAIQFLTEFFFTPLGTKKTGNIVDQHQQRKSAQNVISVLVEVWSKNGRNSRFLLNLFWQLFHPVKGVATSTVFQAAKSIATILAEEASTSEDPKETENYLGVLSDLVSSNGSFITQDQLNLLSTFIVGESPTVQTSCFYTLSIFQKSLDKVGPLRPQFLQDTQSTLMKRLSKFTVRELCAGVPCLWLVSKMKNDEKKLCVVGKSCLKAIQGGIKMVQNKKDVSSDPRIPRLLYILGNIGRYCEIDSYIDDFAEFQIGKPATTVTELLIRNIMTFADSSQALSVRKIAVKNCCTVCISHPLFFLSKNFLLFLDKIFKQEPSELKITVMRSMVDLLDYEESTANSTADMKNTKKPDNVDIKVFLGTTNKFHNEAASTSLMQRYLDYILDLALSSEVELAVTATLLLERIVNQGLANPRIIISTIIALETSHIKEISAIAKNMHTKLHTKHESMIDGSYVDGVRHAANYRISISPDIKGEHNKFSIFYPFLKSSRAGKRKFLLGICRSLDFSLTDDIKELETHSKYTIFVCDSLSSLAFYTVEEVMTLIYGLDKVIAGVGVTVSHSATDQMEKLENAGIHYSNSTSGDGNFNKYPDVIEVTDDTIIEDGFDPESKDSSKSKSPTVKSVESVVNADEVSKIAYASVIVQMIWSLRDFVKRAYNISEERLRDFNPSKPGKDPKPASRSTSNIYDKLLLDKEVDLDSSFTDIPSNISRLRTYLERVSPESQNPDDYFLDGNGGGDEDEQTFVAGSELLPSRNKRSINDFANVSHKKARNNGY